MHSRLLTSLAVLASVFASSSGYAHHSFAVFYESKTVITIEGVAKSFRFTNPHGILELQVAQKNGELQLWTVETTAPVYMRRRGWSKDSIKPGDRLSVEGWPARDGSHLMRIKKVRLPDGTELGQSAPGNSSGE